MTSRLRNSKNSFSILNKEHQRIKYRFCMKIRIKLLIDVKVIFYVDNVLYMHK